MLAEQDRARIDKGLVLVNSATSVAYRLLSLSVLVWLQQFLLSRISPEEYALYPAIVGLLACSTVLGEFLSGGASRYLTEAYARGDDERVSGVISSLLPVLVGAGLLFCALGGLLVWRLTGFLQVEPALLGDARTMTALLVLDVVVQLVLAPFVAGLHVRQRFVLSNAIQLGQECLRLLLLFGLLFGAGTRVLWVVVASVAASQVGTLVRAVCACRLVPSLRFRISRFRWSTTRELMGFGAWTSLGTVANMLRYAAPPLLLNHLGSAVQVSSYYLGSLVVKNLHQLMLFATVPLQPVLTTLHATGQERRMGQLYLRGGRVSLWLTMLPATILLVFSSEIVALYTEPQYADTATVLVLLLSTFPFVYSVALQYRIAVARARIRAFFLWALVFQLLSLAGMFVALLVFDAGAIGVALAEMVAAVVGHVLVFWPMGLLLGRVSMADFVRRTLKPGLVPTCVAIVVGMALRRAHSPVSWLELGFFASLMGAAYLLALGLFCLEPADRDDLQRVWTRIRPLARGSSR